jgi:hypothetical protein
MFVQEAAVPNRKNQDPNSIRIDKALNRLLLSGPFQGSKQCQTLLRFLVENALKDRDGVLKERTIGIEVFGRQPDYNTADDPIVRARVGEVRKRLAQYYLSPEGQDSAIKIVIPSGCYRPTFVFQSSASASAKMRLLEQEPSEIAADQIAEPLTSEFTSLPVEKPWGRRRWAWTATAVAACVIFLAAWLVSTQFTKTTLDLFWAPILDSRKTVVVYTGTNAVYMPTQEFADKNYSMKPLNRDEVPEASTVLPPLEPGDELTAKDIMLVNTHFVTVGDISANVDVTSLLTAHHRNFDLRSGTDVSFGELRKSSAVLIGAFDNSWTLEMTGDLSFVFVHEHIRERGGQKRIWSTVYAPDGTISEDYAVVSRLLDAKTGGRIITIAGITDSGTRAASEFVTDPAQFKKLTNIPRRAWDHNNFQIVLHAVFENQYPTSINVVSVRY